MTEEYRQEETAETFTVTREQMEKMESLAGQLAALNDQHLRLAAEYDNYRKRTTREKETIYQDAKLDTIAKFLEVYDNLERAVSQAGDEENVHKKGMDMIFHQLQGVLEKLGVTVIATPRASPLTPPAQRRDARGRREPGREHCVPGLSKGLPAGRPGHPLRHRAGGQLRRPRLIPDSREVHPFYVKTYFP